MKKIVTCIVVIMFYSCTKEEKNLPQGRLRNFISGTILQFDQFGNPYYNQLNTTTVTVDGTTNSSVTDAKGSFTISNLIAGSYNLSIQKPNCGLYKYFNINLPKGGSYTFNKQISDVATHTISSCIIKDTALSINNNQLKIKLTYTPDSYMKKFIVLTTNTYSSLPSNYQSALTLFAGAGTSSYTSYDFSIYNNYQSGTIIYAKVYPQSWYGGTGIPYPTTFTLTVP